MDSTHIFQAIDRLKQKGERLVTNCFVGANKLDDADCILTGKSLLFVKHEYKVDRLLFYTSNINDLLENAVIQLEKGNYYMDITSRNALLYRRELLTSGFELTAEMMRLSSRNILKLIETSCDENVGMSGAITDATAIYDLLWSVFDTSVSHLPDINEIKAKISQFTLEKNEEGAIISLLQAVEEPKSFYINQIYNNGGNIHGILRSKLKKYSDNGGQYLYSWVDKNNIASLKFHAKYDMKHDGLWNIVYKKTR